MNSYNVSTETSMSWAHKVLGDFNFEQQRGFFAWYYRHTCPPNPDEHASFAQREIILRCKRASAIMLFLAIVMFFVALIAWFGPNKAIWASVVEEYVAIILGIFLNRKGRVNLVGVLLIVAMNGGMYATLFTTAYAQGGLSLLDQQILLILFYGDVVAALLLPFWSALLLMLLHLIVSAFLLSLGPHADLTGSAFATFFRLAQEHVLMVGMLWVMVTQFRQTLARANQGEEIARLSRALGEEQALRVRRGEQLDKNITQISLVLTKVLNGQMEVRIPLAGENVLYQIAGPINHLLDRQKRLEQELQAASIRAWLLHDLMEQQPAVKALVTTRLKAMREAEQKPDRLIL